MGGGGGGATEDCCRVEKSENPKKCNKMGRRASKLRYSGTSRGCFDPKKIIMTSVCARNLTFERFLRIFEISKNVEKQLNENSLFKIDEKTLSISQKIEILMF